MTDTPGETATLNEESRSVPHQAVSQLTYDSVDVARAEQEFNALARQLSRKSEETSPSGATTRAASDVEKGGNTTEEPFDLREYLTTSNDAQQQAGIKVRRVFTRKMNIGAQRATY